jgi:hypothetical protein
MGELSVRETPAEPSDEEGPCVSCGRPGTTQIDTEDRATGVTSSLLSCDKCLTSIVERLFREQSAATPAQRAAAVDAVDAWNQRERCPHQQWGEITHSCGHHVEIAIDVRDPARLMNGMRLVEVAASRPCVWCGGETGVPQTGLGPVVKCVADGPFPEMVMWRPDLGGSHP